MSFFPLSKSTVQPPSPTWSVYDECWGGDEQLGEPESCDANNTNSLHRSQPTKRFEYISYPSYMSTLRGSHLKKKAPIRRGAQGAVYAAYDTSVEKVKEKVTEGHVDAASEELTLLLRDSKQLPREPDTLVAVKRIFIQSNDFGARDISATVLREATVHRFVCAQQERYLAKKNATRPPPSSSSLQTQSDVAAGLHSEDGAPHKGETCLIDDSARLLRLHRVVEAPHKEMCLVLELAATNLEHLLAPLAGQGTYGIGGGFKRKVGTVSLFGRCSVAGGGETTFGLPSTEDGINDLANVTPYPTTAPSGNNTRCPLLSQMPLVRYVMRRLLRIVCFLHEDCGVVHRDLKPSNVLVTETGGLRLGDFGSSRFVPLPISKDKPSELSASHGTLSNNTAAAVAAMTTKGSLECTPPSMRTTLNYRPPEVLLGDQSCSPAADVWALGVMFAQLLLQKNLFHAQSELDLLGAVQKLLGSPAKIPLWMKPPVALPGDEGTEPQDNKTVSSPPPLAEVSSAAPFEVATAAIAQASLPYKLHAGIVSTEGLDLVSRMLNQLPEYRLTVRGAMAHPFLNPGGADIRLTEEDDRAGELFWQEKVRQALQHGPSSESSRARGIGELGSRMPQFVRLGADEDDSEEEKGEDDRFAGSVPFRLNLGGDCSSPR